MYVKSLMICTCGQLYAATNAFFSNFLWDILDRTFKLIKAEKQKLDLRKYPLLTFLKRWG